MLCNNQVLNGEQFDESHNKNEHSKNLMSSPNADCTASNRKISTSTFIIANKRIITSTNSICVSFLTADTV
jgi:hypothetical protein